MPAKVRYTGSKPELKLGLGFSLYLGFRADASLSFQSNPKP